MAPPRSTAAPPNPIPDPDPTAVDEFNLHLLHAASEGDLRRIKRLVRALNKTRRDPREVVAAAKEEGLGALHIAARIGSLPVCRYLVEEIGADVDTVSDESITPLLCAMFGGSMDTIRYLLDHGANPDKLDDDSFAPLHHAAGIGDREMVELLLAKGASVDPVSVSGTPLHIAAFEGNDEAMKVLLENNADVQHLCLRHCFVEAWILPVIFLIMGQIQAKLTTKGLPPLHHAARAGDSKMVELLLAKGVSVDPVSSGGTPLNGTAMEGHDETMQILLENNADCNKKVPGVPNPLLDAITAPSAKCVKLLVEAGADVNDGFIAPLAVAAEIKGLTACLKLLLEAGANPNVPDPSGMLPIELAALNGTREGVEILFPVTSCIPTVHDWSVDGIIRHATLSLKQDAHSNSTVRKIEQLKLLGVESLKRNDYFGASKLYSAAMEYDRHDATLLSERNFCWFRMGDGHEALQDALACREMRPGWPKACYRQGAALMLLKDYGAACDAFLDAAKLDPGSPEIEAALREAMNSLKTSCGAT